MAPVLAAVGYVAWAEVTGTPAVDPWVCDEGAIPVLISDRAMRCASPDTELVEGEVLDPFGNRPRVCDDRWGWTAVIPAEGSDVPDAWGRVECLRTGEEVPDGWTPVPDDWEWRENVD